jgi:hypothetical protein
MLNIVECLSTHGGSSRSGRANHVVPFRIALCVGSFDHLSRVETLRRSGQYSLAAFDVEDDLITVLDPESVSDRLGYCYLASRSDLGRAVHWETLPMFAYP